MPRVRADNDARYALRASFVDENGDVLDAPIVVSWTTSGSDIYYTAGNVGIGKDPTCPLNVASDDYLKVVVEDVSGTDTPFSIGSGANALTIANNVSGDAADEAITLRPANQSIAFTTAGTERMRIDSSGNVGIGMSPSTDSVLEVYGSAAATIYKNTNTGTTLSDGFYLGLGKSSAVDGYVFNRESGSVIFGTNDTERMRLTSAGDVGIGTGSPSGVLAVTDGSNGLIVGQSGENFHAANTHRFFTQGYTTERMRIDANGNLLVGSTTASEITGYPARVISKTSDVPFVGYRTTTNVGVSLFALASDVGSPKAVKFSVRADGDVLSATNSYGSLSDERLKSNIVDASSQIDDIMAVKVRSYTLDSTGDTHIGVVAQELEASGMSGLVDEGEDGIKSVKYSILYMKAIKAIQEQQAMIEELKAEVAALKGAN